MYASGTVIESLPDWYLIERETKKTIDKLNSISELDYYINSADEYLRRLAILRLQKLGLKESGEILREIMDDPVESHTNKYIAAWALKSLLVENDSDYMQNSRYLANFTGREKYEELFPVLFEQEECSIRFQFSSSQYYTAFKINDEDSVLEKDIFFKADFDIKQWVNDLRSSLKRNIKRFLPCIINFLRAAAKKSLKSKETAAKSLSKSNRNEIDNASKTHAKAVRKHKAKNHSNVTLIKSIKENESTDIFSRRSEIGHTGYQPEARRHERTERLRSKDYLYNYDRIRNDLYRRPGFFAFVKKGVFQLFYFLFYPIRFARKHKFAFLCILLSVYAFFAYFSYGRAITNKYAGFDLQEVQSNFFEKVGVFYYQAINEVNRITGINEWEERSKSKQAAKDTMKPTDIAIPKDQGSQDEAASFTVSAKDGLNIRTAPDPSSDRVGSTALPYGTSVTYISSAYSETAGIKWFYVEAQDGRVGWVSSKFLKKAED